MRVSIIIPALNEAACIRETLISLNTLDPPFEIIVVDGGSKDNTIEVASPYAHVTHSLRGRANQMNAGAGIARGEVLLFLHADTRLPRNALQQIRDSIHTCNKESGIFRLRFDKESPLLRFYSYCTRLKQPAFCFGDRALFVRADTFRAIQGFKPIPIFEDLDIAKRLWKRGSFIFLPEYVTTAARRFEERGPLRQQLINTYLWGRYMLGTQPDHLAHYYRYPADCHNIATDHVE